MSYAVDFHPAALEEMLEARQWYARRSEEAANRFVVEVEDAVALIAEAPFRWRERRVGVRQVTLRRFPFFIVYRVKGENVEVLAVAHGRRRPGYWRERTST